LDEVSNNLLAALDKCFLHVRAWGRL
jgi:hypothetical protein